MQVVLKVGVEQKRENQEMKMRLFFIMLCVFSLQYAAHADLATTECLTKKEAQNQRTSARPCACPTGETRTTYTCESGWGYSEAKETCTPNNVSGQDLKGYYDITYGEDNTCAPTTSTYVCYTTRASNESNSNCICTNTNTVEPGTVPNGVETEAP